MHLGGREKQISEFKDSQYYTEKPCLEKPIKKERKKATEARLKPATPAQQA